MAVLSNDNAEAIRGVESMEPSKQQPSTETKGTDTNAVTSSASTLGSNTTFVVSAETGKVDVVVAAATNTDATSEVSVTIVLLE